MEADLEDTNSALGFGFTVMRRGSEEVSYLRLVDLCITQL